MQEADGAVEFRQVGALLRREGLYSSQLAALRCSRDAGTLGALGQRRGRKPADPPATNLARPSGKRSIRSATRRRRRDHHGPKKVSTLLRIVLEELYREAGRNEATQWWR